MTRKEAIDILYHLKPTNAMSQMDAYLTGQAIGMAMKALEHEDEIYMQGYEDGRKGVSQSVDIFKTISNTAKQMGENT